MLDAVAWVASWVAPAAWLTALGFLAAVAFGIASPKGPSGDRREWITGAALLWGCLFHLIVALHVSVSKHFTREDRKELGVKLWLMQYGRWRALLKTRRRAEGQKRQAAREGRIVGMDVDSSRILFALDRCCDGHSFAMLDNGYVYPAATRLSLYRSPGDWAIVIELFGFSPRSGLPDTHIYAFASRLHDRDPPERFATRQAYDAYLASHPHDQLQFVNPIAEGPWLDAEDGELVSEAASEVVVRGQAVPLPSLQEYARHSIVLEEAPRVQVFELCRFLAGTLRDPVLATRQERRVNVPPDMNELLQLEEWHHPDVASGERPSESETFQQLARVLATGDVGLYRPTRPPNTHWRNWPDGGRL